MRFIYSSRPLWLLTSMVAAGITYVVCVNNGFIADDFIILNRIETLKTNPFALVEVTPEIFRLTSYIVIGAFKALFAYDYRPYYVFSILLHGVNSFLLGRVVFDVMRKIQVAFLASILFAVFQAPQEAVMWIGAVNEPLLAFFVLLTLLLWVRGNYLTSLVTYTLALWSKESAPVVLLVIPLIELYRGTRDFWHAKRKRDSAQPQGRYLLLLIPTSIFAAVYLLTLSKNFMLNGRIHAFEWHAVLVLIKSLNGLVWPWAYIFIILYRVTNRSWPRVRSVAVTVGMLIVVLLPYIFVTYTYYVPSRHTYMASAVLMTALAALILQLDSKPLRIAAVASFVLFNIPYVWIRKDVQMEKRAAPTSALLDQLRSRSPGPVRIVGFDYSPYSQIAKAAVITLPGWHWEDVELAPPADRCAECVILEWDPQRRVYIKSKSDQ